MSWPNLLYAVFDQGIRLVDLWLVGHLEADAIAAVGLSHRIMILIAVVSMAISAGATPIVGQAFGAGRYARVRHAASQAVRSMLLTAWRTPYFCHTLWSLTGLPVKQNSPS